MTTLTGYQLSKVANAKLTEVGMKEIPSQMIYNYMKTGKIPFVVVDGKKVIELVEARSWLKNYIANRGTSTTSFEEVLAAFDEEPTETE